MTDKRDQDLFNRSLEKSSGEVVDEIETSTRKYRDTFGLIQCGVSCGLGGLLRSFDHAREITAVNNHLSVLDVLPITPGSSSLFASNYLLGPGGYFEILFDFINFLIHFRRLWNKVEQDIYEEDLVFQIKSLEKKQLLLQEKSLEERHSYPLLDPLQAEKEGLKKKLKTYATSYQKREKRMRHRLAFIWSLLLARSSLFNTPLLVKYIATSVSLFAFLASMIFRMVCVIIDRYKIHNMLNQNEQVCDRIGKEINRMTNSKLKNQPLYETAELNDLCLQHAFRKDENRLLQFELKQKKSDLIALSITCALLTIAAVCSLFLPPFTVGIFVTAVFLSIGLYVIPSLIRRVRRKNKESECLTNIVQIRSYGRSESGSLDFMPEQHLKFKSSLHYIQSIKTLYPVENAKVLLARLRSLLQGKHSTIQKGSSRMR